MHTEYTHVCLMVCMVFICTLIYVISVCIIAISVISSLL